MTTKEQVLQNCTVEGNVVKLPSEQLDRKLYQEIAKALELIGGKWKGGKVFGFVFATDPTDLLKEISNGEKRNLKKEFQFFATPEKLADELVYLADLKQHDTILEPSAGQGAIIKAINKVCDVLPDCYELMEINTVILQKSGLFFNLIGSDFLKNNGKQYSKIIANPPFTSNSDVSHVLKMWDCLAAYGRLVSIMSTHWQFGKERKCVEFRNWLLSVGAEIVPVKNESFKSSGTKVSTCIVIIDKK
jgi:hypothetical protein